MSNFGANQGTQTFIKTDTVGTEVYQIIKLDVGAAGASSPFTGTLVSDRTALPNGYFGTTVTVGTSTLGTIKAGVGGSTIYVTDLFVSCGSATTLVIGNGGTNLPVIGTLSLNPNGGFMGNFITPLTGTANMGVGSALVFQQSANGPLTITCQGYVK